MLKKRRRKRRVVHVVVSVAARQQAFLAAYGRLGSIVRAAKSCHMGFHRHGEWLRHAAYK